MDKRGQGFTLKGRVAEGRKAIGKEGKKRHQKKQESSRVSGRQNPDFLISGSWPNTQTVGVCLMITRLPQERVRSVQRLHGADWLDWVSVLDKFEKDLLSVASWFLKPRRPRPPLRCPWSNSVQRGIEHCASHFIGSVVLADGFSQGSDKDTAHGHLTSSLKVVCIWDGFPVTS